MCGWQQGPSLKEFFLDTSEHRMRLHIGKRHSDKRTVHHCKPKDGGGGVTRGNLKAKHPETTTKREQESN